MKRIGSAIGEYFRSCDKMLLFLWVSASALSVLFLFALQFTELFANGGDFVKTQIGASCIGLFAAIIISLIDYHFLFKLWKLYLPLCLLLVALTFFSSMATIRGGNQAWLLIRIGGFETSLQPSELLKISFITTFAMHLAKVKDELNRFSNVLLLCLHGGVHVLLIQLQGDTGSALVFFAIFLVMIFCAGIAWRYILAAVVLLAAALPLFWFQFMSDDQKMRVLVLFNPELSEAYMYQQTRSLNAMIMGGMQGSGLFREDYRYVRVPEAYNDFIFSFIGEACGFMGCLGVIVLLSVIIFKILYNSKVAKDDEGRFVCIGVFAMMTIQIILNLGMALGVLPVIGVTLPLFSAGGSSVLSLYLGLGFVLSIYAHSHSNLLFDRSP